MRILEKHLRSLKTVLDKEETLAMDDVMDALSKARSSRAAAWRKTPRMIP